MTNRVYCACFGCMNSSTTHPEMTFFRLPGHSVRRLQWLKLINREDLENKHKFTSYRVCEKHFNVDEILQTPNRLRLKKNALPLLMLPNLATTVSGVPLKQDKETQTDPLLVGGKEQSTQTVNTTNANTRRKRKLKDPLQIRKKTKFVHDTEKKTKKVIDKK